MSGSRFGGFLLPIPANVKLYESPRKAWGLPEEFNGAEVSKLRRDFPNEAMAFLEALGQNCRPIPGLTLFSRDVAPSGEICSVTSHDLKKRLEELGFRIGFRDFKSPDLNQWPLDETLAAANEMGFERFVRAVFRAHRLHGPWGLASAVELARLYTRDRSDPYRTALRVLEDGFIRFAEFMKRAYGQDVFKYESSRLEIYRDPEMLKLFSDPKTVSLVRRFHRLLGLPYDDELKAWVVSTIARRSDVDLELARAARAVSRVNRAYPGCLRVETLGDIPELLDEFGKADSRQKVDAITSNRAVAFNSFVQANFGVKMSWDEHYYSRFLELVGAFSENPQALLVLKHYPREIAQDLFEDSGTDIPAVKGLLKHLGDSELVKFANRFRLESWHNLEAVVELYRYPNRDEVLPFIEPQGWNVEGRIGLFIKINGRRVCWDNFVKIKRGCPGIVFDSNVISSEAIMDWLGQAETKRDVDSQRHITAWRMMREELRITDITLDNLSVAMRPGNFALLTDASFRQKLFKAHQAINLNRPLTADALEVYFSVGHEGLSAINAPENKICLQALYAQPPEDREQRTILSDYVSFLSLGLSGVMSSLSKAFELGKSKWRERGATPWRYDRLLALAPHANFGYGAGDALQKLAGEVGGVVPFLADLVGRRAASIGNWKGLLGFVSLWRVPRAAEAISVLAGLLGHPIEIFIDDWKPDENYESYMASVLVRDEKKRKILFDPHFQELCRYVAGQVLTSKTMDMRNIFILANLYERGLRTEKLKAQNFKDTLKAVKRDFWLYSVQIDALPQVMAVADSYDEARMTSALASLRAEGRQPRTGDLTFIHHVVGDPGLSALLYDRGKLEEEAGKIYKRPPSFRTSQVLREEKYTERPDIKKLDSLALLRMVALRRSLSNPKTLAELGRLVAVDMLDKTSERGGDVVVSDGRLSFREVASLSTRDENYTSSHEGIFLDEVMHFHLHALVIDSGDTSGPSGVWYYDEDAVLPLGQSFTGSDLGVARRLGSTGVVISTAGLAGSLDKLLVNVDMYYCDDSREGHVIDLGSYEVNVPPSLAPRHIIERVKGLFFKRGEGL